MQDQTNSLLSRLTKAPLVADTKRAKAQLADFVKRIREEPAAEGLSSHLESGILRDLLLALSDHSPFLWQLIVNDPARTARLAFEPPEGSHRAITDSQSNLFRHVRSGAMTRADAVRAFRQNRNAHALLVALADIGGVWSTEEVTQALSDFADASVAGGVNLVLTETADLGRIKLGNPDAPGEGAGFTVLALGKHGAGELNYSSDIDLVIFFDPEANVLKDNSEAATIYTRIAQQLAKLLQERTADGYVHRVDYRLRPDPGSTPTAMSLSSAYVYYETVGQNWERAAFIKARPVAGDLALGETFLKELRPFIWRKYFDFASIADVHAMKRQIHAVRGHDEIAVAGHDIKLGRGGIREIEFFVQTQQLVFGGRRPNLRGRRTLDMLRALHDEGWITAKARDELSDAYRFLRTIEHRLQMLADEQTQRLPSDEEQLKRFAKFCGYSTLKAFAKALTDQAKIVQGHYALLFEEGPELASDIGSLVFTGTSDDPETLSTLQRLGFREPERVAETVRGWHFGRRPAIQSARAREVLTELTPALLSALGGTADPDGALAALDRAFGRMPAAVELLTILQSHDRLRLLFADLLGTAPRLADTVAQSPHVLDALIDPAFGAPTTDDDVIESQVRQLIGPVRDYEDFLDRIRDAARQMRFVTGARLLSGVLSPAQAGEAYAAIASAVIRASFDEVRRAFESEHGTVPGARVAILGLGRLGSRELTAGSDLDLVVIYDFDENSRESTGPRSLDAVVYHTRLTQRLVSALTVPTRRGLLYEVDLRLRPQGGKGPVASQFKGFVNYQRTEADLWEHMALTRARVLAGDDVFGAEVSDAVRNILTIERDPKKVFKDVRAMRELIAQEKGDSDPWDLKLARGGLTDLDFIAQALVLAHGGAHPALIGQGAEGAFAKAQAEGLLDNGAARSLIDAHKLLNDIFQWQRLTIEGRFDAETAPRPILKRLSTVAGLPNETVLLSHLSDTYRQVTEIYKAVLK
ncbi:bifunctional [glutamine synthetase] adenylyltransferase/[glutamine synthetase]-adenylyl-L-tyrosine phosphorylase [Microvirga lotononidis]|uniref:Bifunctional glutamine synthetase adenylyltransferase/adenylyl-removing enzyme n=1 Tax=Microvirga lotononidis TaxID=864069 RepID=I4YNB5_9HYPH|nr:bifunctional [glutamine synthetase] adenylyltransferase/[glutamine synthetase]-adenylyl-L-tyrosine phosphorylase [Microvirga lotononidis]EIM25457.1 glutamine synthetase adenylyltransferase [Microvirga lotononidis]WQO26231.1 bifunctional [glutamine synthetase] adenylyltransferase/[glutamine synthetase]-adenylyl-L-tyrosine phosphorylase [Microvirga lotononidis]